ncbi:MAG: hypothetical protein C0624_03910 [Desulfuromonas sp.]|nr:MAG: hypothetical protein C0624_03910 [Desulfuromonas sp.]
MHRSAIKNVTGVCFETLCRALLCLLLLVLLVGMGFGVTQTALDLLEAGRELFSTEGLHAALRELVINVLMVLAVVELFRTVKAYFSEGRVKVTYIIDTVLVVVITEIMGFWYRDIEMVRVGMAMTLVVVLMAVRIMAIRFSPKRRELLDGL